MRARLDALLSEAADRGDVPGVAAAVGTAGGTLYEGAFGRRDIGRADAMTVDTVAWIASMTKAITTVALLQLAERGRVDIEAEAGRYCPEVGAVQVLAGFDEAGRPQLRSPKRPVTVRHLLTHTSGYGYDFASSAIRKYMKTADLPSSARGLLAGLMLPLIADPGEGFVYGIGTDWAGRIVEAVTGKSLDAVFAEEIFGPLGMADTSFGLRPDQEARRAAIHAVAEDGGYLATDMMVGRNAEFLSGGGGLYGTARDYLAFTRMILAGGTAGGRRLLSQASLDALRRDQIPGLALAPMQLFSPMGPRTVDFFPGQPAGWSLAFMVNRQASAEGRSAGSLAWGGFANTYYWIDHARGVTGVFVTQIVPFFDPRAVALFRAFEAAVYAELGAGS